MDSPASDDSGLAMGPLIIKGIPWVILLSHFHDVRLPEVYLSIHIKPIARSISSESDAEIDGTFTGSASGSVYATTGRELSVTLLLCFMISLTAILPPTTDNSMPFSIK